MVTSYIVCDDAAFEHETPRAVLVFCDSMIFYIPSHTHTHRSGHGFIRSIELNHHSLKHKIYNNKIRRHTLTQMKHKINFPVENFRIEQKYLFLSFMPALLTGKKFSSLYLFAQ